MTIMSLEEKKQFADDVIDSMKVYAVMQDTDLEFNQKEEKDNLYFIVEHKIKPIAKMGYVSRIDEFDQSSNGYPSMKVIFDFRSNRIYVRLKLRAKTRIKVNSWFGEREFVKETTDIEECFEDHNLKYLRGYDVGSWASRSYHYYEFKYKFNGKNVNDLNKIFLVFFEMRKRG